MRSLHWRVSSGDPACSRRWQILCALRGENSRARGGRKRGAICEADADGARPRRTGDAAAAHRLAGQGKIRWRMQEEAAHKHQRRRTAKRREVRERKPSEKALANAETSGSISNNNNKRQGATANEKIRSESPKIAPKQFSLLAAGLLSQTHSLVLKRAQD